RELEGRSLIDGGEKASLLEQVASLERSNTRLRGTMMMERARADRFQRRVRFMESGLRQIRRFHYSDRMRFRRLETFTASMTPEVIEELVKQRVEEALAAYEATCAANALEAESQSQNGIDGDNGNGRDGNGGNGNGRDGNGVNGNGGNGNGGNGNPNENNRYVRPVVRECTYQDFMKCQPLNFKGTKGVVELIRELMKLMAEGNVIVAEPTRLQDAVRIANNLMDQKLKGYAMKNAENKRRLEVNQRDNRRQQPPFKRPNVGGQNVARAYTVGNNKRKPYNRPLTLCNKFKLHHEGHAL
ncbi:hypothetical protein Tco_1454739, partial [Tanacetum coccineum]